MKLRSGLPYYSIAMDVARAEGMLVKGTTLLTRKAIIERDHGRAAWEALVGELEPTIPSLRQPLMQSSLIPLRDFLAVNDAIVAKFYGGDVRRYWQLGEESGEWALTKGPYVRFMGGKDIPTFVEGVTTLWRTYFHGSTPKCTTGMKGDDVAWILVEDLPVWHPYFEYLVVGYMKRGLELLGATEVEVRCLAGGPKAAGRYHYELAIRGRRSRWR